MIDANLRRAARGLVAMLSLAATACQSTPSSI
jgi:hypothetical protein